MIKEWMSKEKGRSGLVGTVEPGHEVVFDDGEIDSLATFIVFAEVLHDLE